MIDKEIRSGNKIPGCDRMTRPEEVSALGKFLGYVKKVQENSTKLRDDVLGVPGRNDRIRMPEIKELEDRYYKLDPSHPLEPSQLVHEIPNSKTKPIEEISNLKENLPSSLPEINKINNSRENILGKIPTLEDLGKNNSKIPGSRVDIETLENNLEKVPKDTLEKQDLKNLSREKENIPGTIKRTQGLREGSEKIPGSIPETIKLKDNSEPIPGTIKTLGELSSKIEKIEDREEKVKVLESGAEHIPGKLKEIHSLPTSSSSVPSIDSASSQPTSLKESYERIPGQIEELKGLESSSKKIPENSNIGKDPRSLSTEAIPLEGSLKEISNLSPTSETIPGNLKNNFEGLEEESEKVPGDLKETKELYSTLQKLPDTSNSSNPTQLSDVLVKEPKEVEVGGLEEEVEKIPGYKKSGIKSLYETLETIPGNLKNNFEGLEEESEKVPGDLKSNFSKLEDDFEKLPEGTYEKTHDSLSDTYETIPGDLKNSFEGLEEESESIPGDLKNNFDSLSDHKEKINLGENPVQNLWEYKELRPGQDKNPESLSDHIENLAEAPKDPESLSIFLEGLPGDEKNPESLSEQKENIPGDLKNNLEGLSEHIENLSGAPKDPETLSDWVETLADAPKDPESLSDHIETLVEAPKDPEKLSEYQEKLRPETEDLKGLSDYLENLNPEPEDVDGLSDYQEKLAPSPEDIDKLSDWIEQLKGIEDVKALSDYIETLVPTPELIDKLSDILIKLKGHEGEKDRDIEVEKLLIDYLTDVIGPIKRDDGVGGNWSDPQPTELYDSALQMKENEHGEPEELYDTALELGGHTGELRNPGETDILLSKGKILRDSAIKGDNFKITTEKDLKEFLDTYQGMTTDEKYDFLIMSLKEGEEWEKKIASRLSTYAATEMMSAQRSQEYEHFLMKEGQLQELYGKDSRVDGAKYKLPDFGVGMINPSAYLRWIAEQTIGLLPIHGSARQTLLDETLAVLVWGREKAEKLTKSERTRLPGSDMGILSDAMNGGVSGALDNIGSRIGNAVTGAFGGVNHNSPINRPEKDKPITGWTAANNMQTTVNGANAGGTKTNKNKNLLGVLKDTAKSVGKSLLGVGGNKEDYSFAKNYLTGGGIGITLMELCENKTTEDISSVQDLFKAIEESPFMTSARKVTSNKNTYVISTLDSNAFWEIVLEPYLGTDNGNVSFLPCFNEMNTRNIILHGVNTNYNRYVPAISFDLQKAKMTSKSLGLYDGEISYPVSMELMNEFRLTLVDDQYKSWKNFFETAAEVSVYSSLPHIQSYYEGNQACSGKVTLADTQHVIPANYKNVTWRCRIYSMTPQLSTTKRYDLLLVMKDFIEEYSGELEGPAGDLTVTFSIVGENPVGDMLNVEKPKELVREKESGDNLASQLGSFVSSGISSVIKII